MILARGLGLLRLVTNFLHTYDVAGNGFVLVVGASDLENEWIGEGVCVRACFVAVVSMYISHLLWCNWTLIPCIQALAEHHAISRSSNSRGLKVINTDNATVKLRYAATSDPMICDSS